MCLCCFHFWSCRGSSSCLCYEATKDILPTDLKLESQRVEGSLCADSVSSQTDIKLLPPSQHRSSYYPVCAWSERDFSHFTAGGSSLPDTNSRHPVSYFCVSVVRTPNATFSSGLLRLFATKETRYVRRRGNKCKQGGRTD